MEIYELRHYDVLHGRMGDLHVRMRDVVPPLFARNGLPAPSAIWEAVAAPHLPAYLYLLRWPDMAARQAAFDRQYADTNRPTTRDAGGREITERIHLSFLRPAECWRGAADPVGKTPVGGLHEVVIQRVANQRLPMAQDAMAEVDLPALKARGARVLGVFESWIGLIRPGLVTFLAWRDAEHRTRALADIGADPLVAAARKAETEKIGRPLFGAADVMLLRPADYATPLANFGRFQPD